MNARRRLLLAVWFLLAHVATCHAQTPLKLWNIHPDGYSVTVHYRYLLENRNVVLKEPTAMLGRGEIFSVPGTSNDSPVQ